MSDYDVSKYGMFAGIYQPSGHRGTCTLPNFFLHMFYDLNTPSMRK